MPVVEIKSLAELHSHFAKSKLPFTVIDFHADWCGPCHMMKPIFGKLAEKYKDKMNFLSVDVDNAQDVASVYNVTAMPTLIFFEGKTDLKPPVVGAKNLIELEKDIQKILTRDVFSGTGQVLGGASTPAKESVEKDAGKLDPPKILAGLLGLYILFWFFS